MGIGVQFLFYACKNVGLYSLWIHLQFCFVSLWKAMLMGLHCIYLARKGLSKKVFSTKTQTIFISKRLELVFLKSHGFQFSGNTTQSPPTSSLPLHSFHSATKELTRDRRKIKATAKPLGMSQKAIAIQKRIYGWCVLPQSYMKLNMQLP